ncbi:hypothetical protein ACRW9N_03855, partial [Listeria aquatica]|uniref:hypothetical protein n=1 Tax=Listeria aquatica TaxID=1494960 RepID=UPI003EF75BD2
AGLALGLAYGGLEMSAAVSGKDWLTGRELDTSERAMRGAFSLLDIVPGMKAFSGGTQAIRSGTKLASLSDNLLHGVKSIPSKADDLIKLGKSKALTRINSLKTTVKEGIHTGVERTTKGLDKVGEVADNFKNNLNLNSRRQLAADGFGALPAGGTSKVTNATEKMKEVLRKYDLNLNGGGRQIDETVTSGQKLTHHLDEVRSPNSFQSQMGTILEKHHLTLDEFNQLKLKPVQELTDAEVRTLKDIRDSVPKITTETPLQKTIPEGDIEKYLSGEYDKIGGYIAKSDDVGHITGYEDVVESSHLDYTTWDGKRPFPEDGNTYGKLEFRTDKVGDIEIPYGERYGGTNIDDPPCTYNGFTASRNGEVVPEWKFNGYNYPKEGAKLYKVINGKEKLVGIFDGERFVRK